MSIIERNNIVHEQDESAGGNPSAAKLIELFDKMLSGNADAFKELVKVSGTGFIVNRDRDGVSRGFVDNHDRTRTELE